MKTQAKNRIILGFIGVFSLSLASQMGANAQSYSVKTNHSGTNLYTLPSQSPAYSSPSHQYPVANSHSQQPYTGWEHRNFGKKRGPFFGMGRRQAPMYNGRYPGPKYDGFMARLRGEKTLPYQRPAPMPGPGGMFQRWIDYEPQYKFYPGDQLDIVVASAPELSRTLTVGPDGRITMPLVSPIMAAGRSIEQVQYAMRQQLAKQLVDPGVTVTPRAFAPAQVFVGGEVNAQGTYALPGPIGALEALIMAGGMRGSAKTSKIAVLRRAPNGGMMMRSVNIRNGMRNIREYNDNMQLRRGDIIFVPRTTLAEVGNFMQALRAAMPVEFNVSYNIGNNGGGTDPALLNNGMTTTVVP